MGLTWIKRAVFSLWVSANESRQIARRVSDVIRRNTSECACPVPCFSIKYEASLSYAELSRQNTDRYLVPGAARKAHIRVSSPPHTHACTGDTDAHVARIHTRAHASI